MVKLWQWCLCSSINIFTSSWLAGKQYNDSSGAVRPVYVCHTTVATVPPAAEESHVSDPNPGSASQDTAVPKTEPLEPNKETQPAQCRSQESGESPPLVSQERTGTRRTRLTHVHSGVELSQTHPPLHTPLLGCTSSHLPACLCRLLLTTLCPFCPAHLSCWV